MAYRQACPDLSFEFLNGTLEFRIGINHILYCLAGIDYSGVVLTAKVFSDGFQGFVGKVFSEIHRQLPGDDNGTLSASPGEFFYRHLEIFSD